MDLLIKEIDENLDVKSFCCENDDVNNFMYEKAVFNNKNLLSKVYVLLDTDNDTLIGIIALLAYRLNLPTQEKFGISKVPGILIGRIGIDNNFRRKNYTKKFLIPYAIGVFNEVKKYIGCRLLIAEVELNDPIKNYLIKNGFFEIHFNKKYHYLVMDLS